MISFYFNIWIFVCFFARTVVENKDGVLRMSALDSKLDGLGIVDDIDIILKANSELNQINAILNQLESHLSELSKD